MNNFFKHLLAWLCFSSISMVVKLAEMEWHFTWGFVYETYATYVLAAAIFYTAYYWIYKKFYARKQYWLSVLMLLLLLFVNGITRHYIYAFLFVKAGLFTAYVYTFWQSFTIGIWWWYMFSLLSFGYYVFQTAIKAERQLRFAANEKNNAEKENILLKANKLQLRYNYLQAQINPHFLYNTLNFLYYEAEEKNEKLAGAIMALSGIMRYSVSGDENTDLVPLIREVEVLDKYIYLHQLRFGDSLNVQFSKNITDAEKLIPPYIFITLVENAFKHGYYAGAETPICINLQCSQNRLFLSTCNTINPAAPNRPSSRGGLDSIKERLRLTYGGLYRMANYIKEDQFIVELEITFIHSPANETV